MQYNFEQLQTLLAMVMREQKPNLPVLAYNPCMHLQLVNTYQKFSLCTSNVVPTVLLAVNSAPGHMYVSATNGITQCTDEGA